MGFLKILWKNRKVAWQLGKKDFKNRFANTSLGSIWGFLQPFIFMLMYVVVFQFIFKQTGPNGAPYIVWFMPGMSMWMCINDGIIGASGSIRGYSYLVKKVVFPIDIIPIISLIGNAFVALFLFLISTVVCIIFGFNPNILMMIYIIFSAYCFLIAITRFTSALSTLVPDFLNLLGIIMQLFFWATPIVWNLSMLTNYPIVLKILQCMPITYLITGFRNCFMEGNIITQGYGIYTVIFWVITTVMFLWGNSVFKRTKKDFADVL